MDKHLGGGVLEREGSEVKGTKGSKLMMRERRWNTGMCRLGASPEDV